MARMSVAYVIKPLTGSLPPDYRHVQPPSWNDKMRKKKELIPKNGICSLESVRDYNFAFLHEQAGDDADDAGEEAVNSQEQDQYE